MRKRRELGARRQKPRKRPRRRRARGQALTALPSRLVGYSQAAWSVFVSTLTFTSPLPFVLTCSRRCRVIREPSVPSRWIVLVLCSTLFLLLAAAPNQVAKCPLALTPPGSSGVNVAVPSPVPVTQKLPSACSVT